VARPKIKLGVDDIGESLMKTVPLTKNQLAIVDDEDFDRVNQWKWQAIPNRDKWYAKRSFNKNGIRVGVRLHRFIINAPCGMDVDHINGNTLDCRKTNLRICNNSQNAQNRGKTKFNTSGYKGVSYKKKNHRWYSQIMLNKHNYHLGYFDSPEDAAIAYDKKAVELFGEFANINFK
jgi:hypothetical protein